MKYMLIIFFLLIPSISFGAIGLAIYEVRSAGDKDNGGCYGSGNGGTDHSQQDAAHAAFTDLVIDGATNTDITSATTPFASDDVDNCIHITSGTGFTVGHYRVVSVASTVATLDAAVGTVSSTGGNGNLGGAVFLDNNNSADWMRNITAGSTLYVQSDGTHTPADHMNDPSDGTALAPIRMIGYNATRGDAPTGDDRPLIAMGANQIDVGNHWRLSNIRWTTTQGAGIKVDTGEHVRMSNIKIQQTSVSADRECVDGGSSSHLFFADSECVSDNGNGIRVNVRNDVFILHSYIHDCGSSAILAGNNWMIVGNLIDSNTTGVDAAARDFHYIADNVFYNNTTAISNTDGERNIIINNIFKDNTTAIKWTTAQLNNLIDYNLYHGNTTDLDGIGDKGLNAVNVDPGFTNAAGGDFTIGSGSSAIDVGMQVGTRSGALGDYKWNIGTDKDINAAGGGTNAAGAISVGF